MAKARVCKTLFSGSIPLAASRFSKLSAVSGQLSENEYRTQQRVDRMKNQEFTTKARKLEITKEEVLIYSCGLFALLQGALISEAPVSVALIADL